MANELTCRDAVLINDWHVVADATALPQSAPFSTRLLGIDLTVARSDLGPIVMRRDTQERIASQLRYGFVWACIGTPARDIVDIPEAGEDDRYLVTGGSIAVKVSGLRAVENFLDMGHFPFVHTGWLGEEPHTEVEPYIVSITEQDEVLATECRFFQPIASPTATGA